MCDRLEDDSEKFLSHLVKTSQPTGGTLYDLTNKLRECAGTQSFPSKMLVAGDSVVQWLLEAGYVNSKEAGVRLGGILMKAGCLQMVQPSKKVAATFAGESSFLYEILAPQEAMMALGERPTLLQRCSTVGGGSNVPEEATKWDLGRLSEPVPAPPAWGTEEGPRPFPPGGGGGARPPGGGEAIPPVDGHGDEGAGTAAAAAAAAAGERPKQRSRSADDPAAAARRAAAPPTAAADAGVGSPEWRRRVAGPFRRLDPNPGARELLKLGLGLATLVPLRAVLLILVVGSYYVTARAWLMVLDIRHRGLKGEEHRAGGAAAEGGQGGRRRQHPHRGGGGHHHYDGPRGALLWLTRATARACLFLMGFYHVEVSGGEHRAASVAALAAAGEPRVIVANHLSYVEIIWLIAAEAPAFVFKRTCLNLPLVGDIAQRILCSVPVDNTGAHGGAGTQAITDHLRRTCRAVKARKAVRPLAVFPEGTTSNGSCLLKFRTGVFVAGVPVCPVAVHLPFGPFSPSYESIYTAAHLVRLLSQPVNRMQVRYLPLHRPSAAERGDAARYARAVRHALHRALGVPLVDAGYQDKVRFHSWLRLQYARHPLGPLGRLLLVAPDARLPPDDPFRVIPDIPYYHHQPGGGGGGGRRPGGGGGGGAGVGCPVRLEHLAVRDLELFLRPEAEVAAGAAAAGEAAAAAAAAAAAGGTTTVWGRRVPEGRARTSSYLEELRQGAAAAAGEGNKDRPKQQLDLYLPQGRPRPPGGWPVVVFVHGGGWQRGDRRAAGHYLSARDANLFAWLALRVHTQCYGNIGASFARSGVACAVVSYRLSALRFPWVLVEILSSLLFNFGVLLAALLVLGAPLCRAAWLLTVLGSDALLMNPNSTPFLQDSSTQTAIFSATGGNICESSACSSTPDVFIDESRTAGGSLLGWGEAGLALASLGFLFWGGLRGQSCLLFLTPMDRLLPYLAVLAAAAAAALLRGARGGGGGGGPLLGGLAGWAAARAAAGALALAAAQLALAAARQRRAATLHPEHARDVAHAVRWACAAGRAHGLDPRRLALAGHSAGAHLAAALALGSGGGGGAGGGPLAEAGLRRRCIRGVLAFSGVYDLPALAKSHWQKVLYLEPAFGSSPELWDTASPLLQAKKILEKRKEEDDKGMLRSHHSQLIKDTTRHTLKAGLSLPDTSPKANDSYIPPFVLFHASRGEAGLDGQAAAFQDVLNHKLLLNGAVERHVIKDRNHLTIVSDIQDGQRGAARDPAMALADAFLRRCGLLPPRGDSRGGDEGGRAREQEQGVGAMGQEEEEEEGEDGAEDGGTVHSNENDDDLTKAILMNNRPPPAVKKVRRMQAMPRGGGPAEEAGGGRSSSSREAPVSDLVEGAAVFSPNL